MAEKASTDGDRSLSIGKGQGRKGVSAPFRPQQLELPLGTHPEPTASHAVDRVCIRNLRACRDVELELTAFTPLVGVNNAGKTTILRAIAWALSPKRLPNDAYNDPEQPVEVSLRVVGISERLIDSIADEKHRKAIQPYCRDETLWIQAKDSLGHSKVEKFVWDPDACADPSRVPAEWKKYPTGLPEAVAGLLPDALHIDATKDLNEDLGKAKAGTTIKGLLDEIMGPVLDHHAELQDAIATIRSVLDPGSKSRSPLLTDFDRKATRALQDFFPGLGLHLNPASVELKEFFKAGDLMVRDRGSDELRRFDQVGAGAQRSIQMALVRRLADLQRPARASPSRRLLLIDEPELFLHPQGVRYLRNALEKLSRGRFQVVFTTHSPLMLSPEAAGATVLVGKNEDGTFARVPLKRAVENVLAGNPHQARVLFELGSLSEIYFSDRVVLCEGKTDEALLPILEGKLPTGTSTAFVSLRGCNNTKGSLDVLKAMEVNACAIVDLDFGFGNNAGALLEGAKDIQAEARKILRRLASQTGVNVGANGFPQKGDRTLWPALARDGEGSELVNRVHAALREHRIWLWKSGCIEDVLGIQGSKGEDAIACAGERLEAMRAQELTRTYPEACECLAWIRSGENPGLHPTRGIHDP